MLTQIDAARVYSTLQDLGQTTSPGTGRLLPGPGGLSRVLRGLHAHFDFTTAERGTVAQLPLWRLEGSWRPEVLAAIMPQQAKAIKEGKPADLQRLPQQLPDHVVLLLGQEDLFPYRIEYRRTVPQKGAAGETAESRSLVTMELFEVNLNMRIDPARFLYRPGKVDADLTDNFLQALGVKK
jgi:hypothetical protein